MAGSTENAYRERLTFDRVTWGTHCSNCIATCSYRVYARDGGVAWEEQSGTFPQVEEGVPDRNPMGCQKGAAWSVQLDSGDRLLYPMKRAGERGEGRWERVTWDDALAEVADSILDAIEESGPEAVLVDEGPEGGMLTIGAYMRFANVLGCVSLDGNATVNDFPAGHYVTFGTMAGGSSADDTFHAELVLIWHANPAYTRIPYFHYLTEARWHGAEVVLIAPDCSPSAMHADLFVPVAPGSDAALALSMCRVVLDEGLEDTDFVAAQTDLPLLVRTDTRRLLRESDLVAGGGDETFFVWDPAEGRAVAVVSHELGYDFAPALEGHFMVETADGSTVEVAPVMVLLRERLDGYAPESAGAACGVNPDVIRMLARKVARSRTKLHEGFDTAKHYHGDLMERSMDLLLALTGNWGRKGTGFDTFCGFSFAGAYLLELKERAGLDASSAVLDAMGGMLGGLAAREDADGRRFFPPQALWGFSTVVALAGSTTPPFWFWEQHCGYPEIWAREGYGASPRPFAEYVDTARPQWGALARPGPGQTPRVLIEVGTNALRRTRGGGRMLLRNLWPKLSMIVSLDNRVNTAGMYADILLPAAHEAERVNLQYPVSHSMELTFSDRAVEPAGEARSDWQILGDLAEAVARRAVDRGMGERVVGRARQRPLSAIGDGFRLGGAIASDEAVLDELVRDTALAGVIPPDASLATLRERGWMPIQGNGPMPGGQLFGSAFDPSETFCGFRWHVERGMPYATMSGRATFYVDHEWFLEAGEELPAHKLPPASGGEHPFVLTGGHPRWSIHACNATNPVLMETTRGHPTLVMNSTDAARLGICDDSLVEVCNDLGSMQVAARLSGGVRPGQVILYAAWEPYGFSGWADGTQVEAGMVKWLHLATGWGHLRYSPLQWQPAQSDRNTRVAVRPAPEPRPA